MNKLRRTTSAPTGMLQRTETLLSDKIAMTREVAANAKKFIWKDTFKEKLRKLSPKYPSSLQIYQNQQETQEKLAEYLKHGYAEKSPDPNFDYDVQGWQGDLSETSVLFQFSVSNSMCRKTYNLGNGKFSYEWTCCGCKHLQHAPH